MTSHPTAGWMRSVEEQGSSVEEAAAARQAEGDDHDRRETPPLAKSIERLALC